ncbi:MAG: hypothetical protein ACC661_02105 [Verrucomicrobiales bacterium]
MLDEIFLLIKALGEPEYLYLLLEPAFIYGIGIALVVFVAGFLLRDGKAQMLGLVMLIVSSLMIVPYLAFRAEAAERIESVYKLDNPATLKAFKAQSKRYQDSKWAYVTLGGVAGAVLLVGAGTNRVGFTLAVVTVIAGTGVVLFSLSMHLKEAQIHHPNLLAIKPINATG